MISAAFSLLRRLWLLAKQKPIFQSFVTEDSEHLKTILKLSFGPTKTYASL